MCTGGDRNLVGGGWVAWGCLELGLRLEEVAGAMARSVFLDSDCMTEEGGQRWRWGAG